MAVKGNPEKILTCANEAEKDQWVRCLKLVMIMNQTRISFQNATKVSIFAYEKVYNTKWKSLAHQNGLPIVK